VVVSVRVVVRVTVGPGKWTVEVVPRRVTVDVTVASRVVYVIPGSVIVETTVSVLVRVAVVVLVAVIVVVPCELVVLVCVAGVPTVTDGMIPFGG
jgi:hypothetical protein